MVRGGGFELQKRSVEVLFDQRGTSRHNKGNRKRGVCARRETPGSWATASGRNSEGYCRLENFYATKFIENFYATKSFCKLTTERIDQNIYIIGAGA